jgi:hypothetical protein
MSLSTAPLTRARRAGGVAGGQPVKIRACPVGPLSRGTAALGFRPGSGRQRPRRARCGLGTALEALDGWPGLALVMPRDLRAKV